MQLLRRVAVHLLLFSTLLVVCETQGQVVRPILVPGQQAPGLTDGVLFETFTLPRIAANGDMVLHARLEGTGIDYNNDWSVWTYQPDTGFQLVAKEGELATGIANAHFRREHDSFAPHLTTPFFDVGRRNTNRRFTSLNDFIFEGRYREADTGNYREAFWRWKEGQLSLLAANNTPVPGFPQGTEFRIYSSSKNRSYNAPDGTFYFEAAISYANGEGGFAYWKGNETDIDLVVEEGADVPNQPGFIFDSWYFAAAFNGGYYGSYTATNDTDEEDGVGIVKNGVWSVIIRENDQISNMADGYLFGSFQGRSTFDFSEYRSTANSSGQVGFRGFIKGNDVAVNSNGAIFVGDEHQLLVVARENDPAPGANGKLFEDFEPPVINEAGTFVFKADLKSTPNGNPNSQGIWMGSIADPTLVPIAVINQPAPSFAEDTVFDWLRDPSISSTTDTVVFYAHLDGSDITWNDRGLWIFKNGTLKNIAQDGDSVDLGEGNSGTISYFANYSGLNGGHMAWFDDLNQRILFDANVAGVGGVLFAYPIGPLAADAFQVTQGVHVGGVLSSLERSDNQKLLIQRAASSLIPFLELEIDATSATSNPGTLEFTVEASVFARRAVTQTILLYDYNTGNFEEVDSRLARRFSDLVTTAIPSGDLARFVEPGTGNLKAKIKFTSTTRRQLFSVNVDQTVWTID